MKYQEGVIGTGVVLINGFHPSDVVMGVRDYMNVKLSGDNLRGCVVSNELGFCKWKHN